MRPINFESWPIEAAGTFVRESLPPELPAAMTFPFFATAPGRREAGDVAVAAPKAVSVFASGAIVTV